MKSPKPSQNNRPKKAKTGKRKPFPKKLSRQYRWQIMRKGVGRCPICGKKPDKRAVKSKLCTKHLKAQRLRMRKRVGVKRPFLSPEEQADLDWSLGYEVVAAMTGRTLLTVKRWFTKLVVGGKIKASACPDHSAVAAAMHRKSKVREVLDSV